MAAVVATTVSDEIEADMVCGLLRSEGIECFTKRSNMSAGIAGVTGGGGIAGGFEVWVDEANLERARELAAPADEPT